MYTTLRNRLRQCVAFDSTNRWNAALSNYQAHATNFHTSRLNSFHIKEFINEEGKCAATGRGDNDTETEIELKLLAMRLDVCWQGAAHKQHTPTAKWKRKQNALFYFNFISRIYFVNDSHLPFFAARQDELENA